MTTTPQTMRSLKILFACSWITLSLCAIVFIYFAIAIPNVVSDDFIKNRDKNVQEIRASTDLRYIQEIATFRTQLAAYVMDSSRMLLIISVGTLLLCMLGSGISLFQIRKLRRAVPENKSGAGP